MDIFDLLEDGILVAWDREQSLLVLWNTSLTFRLFHVEGILSLMEVNAFTTADTPDLDLAKKLGKEWLEEISKET